MAIRASLLLVQLVLASCQVFTQLAPVQQQPGDASQATVAAPHTSATVSTADELAAALHDAAVTVVRVNGAPSSLARERCCVRLNQPSAA